jgi:hypothetical protein
MIARAVPAVLGALTCAAAAVAVWAAAFHGQAASTADERALVGFLSLWQPRLSSPLRDLANLFNVWPFVAIAAGLVAIAVLRGPPLVAAAIGVILVGANLTTQLLEPLVAAPRPGRLLASAAWPSGHATAAASVAPCLVLLAPLRHRPMVAAGAGTMLTATVYSILLLSWHRPTDVLGGMLVAGVWMFIGIAVLRAAEARRSPAHGREGSLRAAEALGPTAIATAVVALVLTVVVVASPGAVLDHPAFRESFLIVVAIIGAVAMSLLGVTSLALTRGCSKSSRSG